MPHAPSLCSKDSKDKKQIKNELLTKVKRIE